MNQHHSRPNLSVASPPTGRDPAPPESLANPWEDFQQGLRPRVRSMYESRHRSSETLNDVTRDNLGPPMAFPEPQFFQPSPSSLQAPQQTLHHRHSRSDFRPRTQAIVAPHHGGPGFSAVAASSSYRVAVGEYEPFPEFQDEGTKARSLDTNFSQDDALKRFQDGELKDEDQEWHRLVSTEAREALGKKEVNRQCVLFEIIKGERDYVVDLETVQRLFVEGLRNTRPPIIHESMSAFIKEVFGNLDEILSLHRRLLESLFARQREQHPLLQSVADIILDTTIKTEFRSAYETYIKHYPLAESCHRKELKRNSAYQAFVQSASSDPLARKRDLITFLSRPVTRLPRLNLLLDQTLRVTEKEYEHPDLETLPLILNILGECIKSTQPGIEAAESRVKVQELCETLVYQAGEIIDMDLRDESRALVYSSSAARRIKSESGFHGWSDIVISLLDNYLLLTREEKQSNSSVVRRYLISRPIHLSFLRLGSFTDPFETRKERAEDRSLFDSLRSQTVSVFPFTIYHASSPSTRRYTLYVPTEAHRQQWKSHLVDAIAVHRVREDSNKWFDPQQLFDHPYRVPSQSATSSTTVPVRRITSAVPFSVAGHKFLAIGCFEGIFVSAAGDSALKRALNHSNPKYVTALQSLENAVFNRFIVHTESALLSYPLELLAQVALEQATPQALNTSMESIGGNDSNIVFSKCIPIGKRAILIYASKRRLSSTLTLQVMEAVSQFEKEQERRKNTSAVVPSFKPFGEAGFIPRDAHDVIALTKMIGICTKDGIVIADPTNLARSVVTLIPDLHETPRSPPMSNLKARIDGAKPLGLVRVDANELLIIYDMIGCYTTKHGVPSRSCRYIRWENPISGFTHRGSHVLLTSAQFIEIRHIKTGRIVQVIEDVDIRLMYCGSSPSDKDPILVAARGDKSEGVGIFSDKLMQLVETTEYVPQVSASTSNIRDLWEEWDM